MIRFFLGAMGLLGCLAPYGTGQAEFLGSEATPEVVDAAGDVSYDVLHVEEKDHYYLDILSAWISYNASQDVFEFTVKVEDTQQMKMLDADYQIGCSADADGVVDEKQTDYWISWRFLKQERGTDIEGHAYRGSQGQMEFPGINSTFEVVFGQPGYFRWATERVGTQFIGDVLGPWRVYCYESWFPQGLTRATTNSDRADSAAQFELARFGRTFELPEPSSGPREETGPREAEARDVPSSRAFEIAAALLAAGLAFFFLDRGATR